MATLRYFINSKKRKLAPIYVRLSVSQKNVFIANTLITVDPKRWSNKKQKIALSILSPEDESTNAQIYGLHDKTQKPEINIYGINEHLEAAIKNYKGEISKEWLQTTIDRFYNKVDPDTKTLNGFIDTYIKEAEAGTRKNANKRLFSPGTIRAWRVFQRNFNEYQGIYTPRRLKYRKKEGKPIRERKILNFNNITIDFYNDFVNYLTDEGFMISTIGRHIKELKYFMTQAMQGAEPLHDNREFEQKAFKTLKRDSYSIYLTESEIEKIYNLDLSKDPEMDTARDAFIVLCETALRISDYKKVSLNIRSTNGTKLIYIKQTKTGGDVIIPLSDRMEAILNKYDGKLPDVKEQYVNRDIKHIAERAGINEKLTYTVNKYGKDFDKTVKKWQLVTCHTGRRSAATNMYLAKIPTISIMAITGHKTEKVFLNYIKVTAEQNALKLAQHAYFNKLKIV